MLRRPLALLLCLLLFAALPARALDIRLVSGDWQPINIVIEIFLGEEALSGDLPSDIIGNDLTVSGHFKILKETVNSSAAVSAERLAEVRDGGGEYLLTGSVQASGGGYTLAFSLYDALTGDSIGSYKVPFTDANKRQAAHQVANWIYEEVVGSAGVFHTKIAYVLRSDKRDSYELKIADFDGHNRLTILSSKDPVISPSWSPDGNTLLYVSFEQDKPIIYRQSLLTGSRDIIANFKGSNSAPAMAPDNRTIAAALTEHGGQQQIYFLSSSRKSRLRHASGINTEPVFSPDGTHLAFTSDESGSPQTYLYDLQDNTARRLTFGSRYNVSPAYSAQGDTLALVRRDDNGNNIALLDIASGAATPLTAIRLADSPSFAPNDDIVAFIDETNKKYLATVAINGKVMLFWAKEESGDIIDPVWSPLKSDWF